LSITIKKIIGTVVPMSAIFSSKNLENDKGTFAAGLVFLDWLKKTQQSAWQMLPLQETQLEENSTTKHISSPYKSYGIGLHPRYLSTVDAQKYPTPKEKELFLEQNKDWLGDYALFCALRDHFQTDDWRKWESELRYRDKSALSCWKEKLFDKVDFYITQQWQLDQSYTFLRFKAKALGIILIGDLPFYISVQSPLVWMYQDVFQIEEDGTMPMVSGIPGVNETYFGRQIWGHPLYDWKTANNRERIITLWKTRIKYQSRLFDQIRVDHANGFFEYGVINMQDATKDTYKKGPGTSIFEELIDYSRQQGLTIFVEDSGENLKLLSQSMQRKNISGVKVFLFSFGENITMLNNQFVEIFHYPRQTVAYTSIHDTVTLLGFLESLDVKHKKILASAANIPYSPDNKKFAVIIRSAILKSSAQMIIIPIQDWLLTKDRINIPGTECSVNDPNWNFHVMIPIEDLPTNLFSLSIK
jgi:4-alpha-glucanotransferase